MSRRARRTFTEDFKAEAVALVKSSGKPISQVARDLDLTVTALREWVRKAEGEQPRKEGPLDVDERSRLRRLEEENRVLRMERDFRKKAASSLSHVDRA